MLGDSLIKHENTIYIYNQKSTQFGAVYVPLPGRWYPTVEVTGQHYHKQAEGMPISSEERL